MTNDEDGIDGPWEKAMDAKPKRRKAAALLNLLPCARCDEPRRFRLRDGEFRCESCAAVLDMNGPLPAAETPRGWRNMVAAIALGINLPPAHDPNPAESDALPAEQSAREALSFDGDSES